MPRHQLSIIVHISLSTPKQGTGMSEPINIFDRTIIIDNFYSDPDMVRNYALINETEEKSQGNYGGIMTNERFVTEEHITAFSQLAGHKVKQGTGLNGKFRFTQEDDTYKQLIHFDVGENLAWAGVVYLTPTDHDEGTIFYKHKRTGLIDIPRTQEGIEKHGWDNPDDLKVFLDTDGMDESVWEREMVVPYRYNRLIMFRPWLFHAPGQAFGNTLETARLVQTFFFSPDLA